MAIDDLLHSQVALYGEIDDQVVEARRGTTAADAAVVATAEAFLPGSTGFGQAGWLGDLTTFLNGTGVRRSGQSRFEFPTFADATGIVAGAAVGEPGSNRSGTPRSIPFPKAQVRRSIFDPARDPALARSVYASVILEKLYRIRNPDAADPRGRADPVANLFAATPSIVNSWADAHGPSRTDSQTLDLLTGSLDGIRTRMEWMDFAATNFGPAFADTSKACFGTLEDSDGLYCSTIYTDSTAADVSVDQIAQIIDPVNWPYCSQFFAEMNPQVPACDRNGWTRLVESIGAETAEYTIETALVFHFTDNRASATNDIEKGIFLNYTLDPNRVGDSWIVEVDNGYVWVTPHNATGSPGDPGVRIRSSKEERINGLSPTATSALACLLGWGDAGRDMIAGTARRVFNNPSSGPGHDPEIPPLSVFEPFVASPQSAARDTPLKPATPPATAKLPPNFGDTVNDTRDLVKDLIGRAATVGGDAFRRWRDGLTPADLGQVATEFGQNLREWADTVYQTAEDNVRPKDKTGGGV